MTEEPDWRERAWRAELELEEARRLLERYAALVQAHHAVGAMEPIVIGETCPVCKAFTKERS